MTSRLASAALSLSHRPSVGAASLFCSGGDAASCYNGQIEYGAHNGAFGIARHPGPLGGDAVPDEQYLACGCILHLYNLPSGCEHNAVL